jgi:predicted methyltransferase
MNHRWNVALPLFALWTAACAPQVAEAPSAPSAAEEAPNPKDSRPQETPESANPEDAIARALAATDRSAEDRALDAQRKPDELLKFFGVTPGQRVAELAAGRGYTAELLARVVGPEGKVYAQNSPFILQKFAEGPWSERLKTPAMKNVVRVDSEFDAPLPQEASNLDAVFLILFYHDTVWFKTDRAKMNQAIFAALKPGGIYAVVDHSAKEGEGVTVAESLHRIEESVLRAEIEAAGFELAAEGEFLRNPADTRDWNASPSKAGDKRGESDRFVLKFVKPAAASRPKNESAAERTECTEPRRPMCTREYRPVCADVDTGIRCITTPCPSVEQKTYANGCTACADSKVLGYREGACPSPE